MARTAKRRFRLARRLSALGLVGLVLPAVAPAASAGPKAPAGGWLGVALVEVPGKSGSPAIRIIDVLDASPAAAAGLREGDVIRTAGGETVSALADLTRYLEAREPGDPFRLTIDRGGATVEVQGTLGQKQPSYVFSRRGLSILRGSHGELQDETLRRSVTALRRAIELAGRQPELDRASAEAAMALLATPDRWSLDLLLAAVVGFEVDEISPELRVHFGAPEDAGLLVSRVVGDSPAERAGLRVGDLMIRTGSRPVVGLRDLVRRIMDWPEGRPFPIEVVRDGSPMELAISVEGRLVPPLARAALPRTISARIDAERGLGETLQQRIRMLEERLAEMEALLESLRPTQTADPGR